MVVPMLSLKDLKIEGFERVVEISDPEVHLHGYIAIHSTSLGPTMGGTRIYPYTSKEEALADALRLAKGMTYKSAVAENGLGGGKAVIIADPKRKTEKLLLSFAEAVNSLKGVYITAEDVGSTTQDMEIIRKKTPYVAALEHEKSSGDPSRFTAWGIYKGMEAVCQTLWNAPSLKGKTIAIQGVGSVGSKLANIVFWLGTADVIICDVDEEKAHQHAILYGAEVVPPEKILSVECDIFAPCALGGILNDESIPKLKCKAIAGSANNQLLDRKHGYALMKRNILYAPDYIINSGGIINAAIEFAPEGYNPKAARDKVNQIYDTLMTVFEIAKRQNKPTSEIADTLAEYKLKYGIGKRQKPISFKR